MRKRWATRGLLGLLILGVGHLPAFAGDSLYGKVRSVSNSAEIVTLAYRGGQYDVRIAGIVVPPQLAPTAKPFVEKLVPPGTYARMRLVRREGSLMVSQLLTGNIAAGIKDVGIELLRNGLAVLPKQPVPQRAPDERYGYKYGELTAAENEGRKNAAGFWAPTPALTPTPLRIP